MKILITGNMGYIGPSLIKESRAKNPNAHVVGLDSCFFGHCLTTSKRLPEALYNQQLFMDVRDAANVDLLRGVDAIIHLAAVSNDPMGNRFEKVTEEINQQSSLRLAKAAKEAGVKHFVFASSCSVYGTGSDAPRKEQDDLNPLTAYARSKIGTETGLQKLADETFTITCLRFATACGFSDRLRLDLVLNDFVACAIASGKITILSDGTPWRPLIDVDDMSRALLWAATRKQEKGGAFLVVNTGSDTWNYQVRDLAHAVAAFLPGTEVSISASAQPDKRSYRVDFGLFRSLAPEAQPLKTLQGSIADLAAGLKEIGFNDSDFRQGPLMRLRTLTGHIEASRLTEELRWIA